MSLSLTKGSLEDLSPQARPMAVGRVAEEF